MALDRRMKVDIYLATQLPTRWVLLFITCKLE